MIKLMELWWDLILKTGIIFWEGHISHLLLHLFFVSTLPKRFGIHARTKEINLATTLDKLSFLDRSGLAQVLVSMLDLMTLTMHLLHFSTRSSKNITDTLKLISIIQTWIIINLIVHHYQLMKTGWSYPLELELLEILLPSHSVPVLVEPRDYKLNNLLLLLLKNLMVNSEENIIQ